MKRCFWFVVAVMIVPMSMHAQKIQRGSITYDLGLGNYSAQVEACETDVTEIYLPYEINYQGHVYTVNNIGNTAFEYCTELTSINLPNAINHIGANAFLHCEKLDNVIIPDNITELRIGTFRSCLELKNIHLPENLTTIGDFCFYDAHSLTEVVLPEGFQQIGMRSFRDCISLSHIVLPSTIEDIGEEAFMGCKALELIEINSAVPPTTDKNAFYQIDCSQVEVIVPDGSLEAYTSDEVWKQFFNLHEQHPTAVTNTSADAPCSSTIFDISGHLLPTTDFNSTPTGIYLIKNADGSVTKVLKFN